jgi:exopolyphosphatase / guanosine-5'-triphosphate,3'-diphosphate pyrophosphatase
MPTFAAIDVGSNAMRLTIGTSNGDRKLTVVDNLREAVRLGQDVFTTGLMSEQTIESAVEAFVRFRQAIDARGAQFTRAVATSAAREAMNKDIFLDRIAQASGIEIAIIGADEEARLIHVAVAERINLRDSMAMLIDIGGGSTEITVSKDGKILTTESFKMGAVRLLQVLEGKKHGEKQFNQLVREYVDASQKKLKKEIGNEKIDLCIGTGGNIETLGDLRCEVLGKEKNTVLALDELDALVRRLVGTSFEERVSQLRLRPDRADVIVPASIVLQRILRQSGAEEVMIPHVGLKDGLLLDMVQEIYGGRKSSQRDQVLSSAMAIGRKYSFDEQHGQTVSRFAVQLFDETKQLHNLPVDYRLLLEVAALLHDIGGFVGMAEHHKHTLYLLNVTPIVGLSAAQAAIVANTARYHRKSQPKPQHDGYRILPAKDRVVVSKLASLLRLADAMDNEHASKVTEFSVDYKKPRFVMRLKGDGDLLLEKWALLKKSQMFEDTFSVKVAIED